MATLLLIFLAPFQMLFLFLKLVLNLFLYPFFLYVLIISVIIDKKIVILGLVQSLFEASMYTFVFMWTPALTEGDDKSFLPFGLIFACCILHF